MRGAAGGPGGAAAGGGGGEGPVLVTGGSGFVGSNLADALLGEGREVVVLDNLSRPGVERNLHWLQARHGGRVRSVRADVRDAPAVREAARGVAAVVHLAAQTAVTTSLTDPSEDFEVNARGTLNVLEAVRALPAPVPVIFASTNKVYGALADLPMADEAGRHEPLDDTLRSRGVDEGRPLDFCTPYGCSKGVADQYVLDYARSFGVPAAVLRMSCVYGPRQFGTEDQGWVAHFLLRALAGEAVTVYGDGRQVRDVLHVRDAVAAYLLLLRRIDGLGGRAFNLGGGPGNAVSLREVIAEIGRLLGRPVAVAQGPWRQGDQPWFVADCAALARATGWAARTGWRDGLADLAAWLRAERAADGAPLAEPARPRVRARA